MAANKYYEYGSPLQLPTPSTVKSGDPLVFGSAGTSTTQHDLLCGVANEDATDAFSNVKATTSFDTRGAFLLDVEGEFGSPLVLHAFKPGDPIYADIDGAGASYDATTNCWTGFKLNGNAGGVLFGWVLQAVPAGSGVTNVPVLLKGAN